VFFAAGCAADPAVRLSVFLADPQRDSRCTAVYFDLGSATFAHDRGSVNRPARRLRRRRRRGVSTRIPELRLVPARGEGRICTNFPYAIAASSLIVA